MGDGAVNCAGVVFVIGEPMAVIIIGEPIPIKPGLGAMIGCDGELACCWD